MELFARGVASFSSAACADDVNVSRMSMSELDESARWAVFAIVGRAHLSEYSQRSHGSLLLPISLPHR